MGWRGWFPARPRCRNHPLPTPGWCRGLGLRQPSDAAHGIGECSVQIVFFKLSHRSWQKALLSGVFSAEGWKPGFVVISSGALPRAAGLTVVTEFVEHHCGGCCAGQCSVLLASEGCCRRHCGHPPPPWTGRRGLEVPSWWHRAPSCVSGGGNRRTFPPPVSVQCVLRYSQGDTGGS